MWVDACSLIGAQLDRRTIAFVGWFGPRAIASVLYLLMAVAAIGMSVYAHGISAVPISALYGRSTTIE